MRMQFSFTRDGRPANEKGEVTITYVGRVDRKKAEADALRRFEEWARLRDPLARRWSSHQVVLS